MRTIGLKQLKLKRALWMSIFCVLACVCISGCGKKNEENAAYHIFYLNQDKTVITSQAYEPESSEEDTLAMVEELLTQMEQGTEDVDFQRAWPDSVKVESYEYEGNRLHLYFNSAYGELQTADEVLCRAAIARCMLQIKGISGVSFYVDGQPLTDANGNEVGVMTQDSFVDNPGEEINDIKVADLTLYFASLDGQSLVSETQHVHYYSSNISTEKLVMEQLLEGPNSENAQAAIPEDTTLISVSVMDGACIVNLDENFLTQNYEVAEDVVIYSIVNSLMELSTVESVQISVNGKTNMTYRQNYSLKDSYTMNRDLIQEEGDDVEVEQDNKQEKESLIDSGTNLINAGP